MTPFELALEDNLNIESQRFANEWLFKWDGMSDESGIVDVDDFRGGRIRCEGRKKYGGQQQQIFWDAVHRYLMKKVHETFGEWERATVTDHREMRLWSLNAVERSLRDFQVQIRQLSMDTDLRLRGIGLPERTKHIVGPRGSVRSEIARLAAAPRALLIGGAPTGPVILQHMDSVYDKHKRLIWFGGVIAGGIGAVAGFLFY